MMWAFLMWSEWAYEMLEASKRPGGQPIYGLPAMFPVIEFGMLFRVEITKTKTLIEISMGFLSVWMLFTGRIAPIFPIFFWQYLRIKYLMSNFMQVCFRDIDNGLKRVLPHAFYNYSIAIIKNRLAYFVAYGPNAGNG